MHRRRYLALAGAGAVGALAGCGGSGGSEQGQSIDDHPAAAELAQQPRRGALGDHVVLAFEDPSCTACRRFHQKTVPDIESNIVEPGAGAYVVRTYPIIYPWGKPATQALEATAARSGDAFWTLFGHYFSEQAAFDEDNVLDRTAQFLSDSTELDGSAVADDARAAVYDDAVQADITAAEAADLPQQTPIVLLFRDGQFVSMANGSVSYEVIAEALGV